MFLLAAGHDPDKIDILHHLLDSPTFFGMNLSQYGITKHVWLMWLASALLILLMTTAARRGGVVPRGLQGFFEPVLLFIKEELAVPNFHEKADKYCPYLWTTFFFILFCNLLGLFPGSATATGNLSITAGLALISFFGIHMVGIKENGLVGYAKSIVPEVPWWLWPLLLVVELVGILTKPFALAVRLWANMNGGHIIILVLLGFIFMVKNSGILVQTPVVAISIGAATAIYFLEIFVALVQAYVFTFLTAVFIGMAAHPDH
ncbi:MAG: F0F1 ATP synthase subunit A [Gemmatimonadetes bacterium]|nr:F0F1 ATP synthase subunit A [Gemmatimonadota bacterium]